MERLQYASSSLKAFRRECNKFSAYTGETTGEDNFTEELGAKYLKDKYDFPSEIISPVKRSAAREPIFPINMVVNAIPCKI